MTFYKKTMLVLLMVFAIGGVLKWSAWHDTQVALAADKYEQCVKTQYHTTPSAWYAEHGEYPDCEQ